MVCSRLSSFFSVFCSPPSPPFHHMYPIVPPKIQSFLWKWLGYSRSFSKAPPQSGFDTPKFAFYVLPTPNKMTIYSHITLSLGNFGGNFSIRLTLTGMSQFHSFTHLLIEGLSNLKATQKAMEFMSSCVIVVHLEREELKNLWRRIWRFYFCLGFLFVLSS